MAIKVDSGEIGSGGYRIGGTLAEINIIPLVDVTLVLLLIFMLTAPLMYRGIDVNLPKTAGKPTAVEERMVLTLSKEQTIYINDKPVPLASLEQALRDLFKNRQDKTLYLRATWNRPKVYVVNLVPAVAAVGVPAAPPAPSVPVRATAPAPPARTPAPEPTPRETAAPQPARLPEPAWSTPRLPARPALPRPGERAL